MDQYKSAALKNALARAGFFVLGFWIIIVISIPLCYFLYTKTQQSDLIVSYGVITPDGETDSKTVRNYSYVASEWLAVVSSVWLFGALGATASYISRSPIVIGSSAFAISQVFGIIFASVMTLIFIGGLISGSLFPDFSGFSNFIEINMTIQNWSKLLVWSFVAGFFERFVPDMLRSLIRQAQINEDIKEIATQISPEAKPETKMGEPGDKSVRSN